LLDKWTASFHAKGNPNLGTYIQRYLNEYAFRFNRRSREMKLVFADVVSRVAESKNLYYSILTEKVA
jgi:hypothetical protein